MVGRREFLAGATALAVTQAGPAFAATEPKFIDMGGPQLAPDLMPQQVRVKRDFIPGAILVLSSHHYLYYIVKPGVAIRYGVAVGKAELVFRGAALVGRKVEWPSWKPTPEMIARNPKAYMRYADGMKGGPNNPLGARALYLYRDGIDTAIRIHGTTEPMSIGKSVSNGCIRMVNEHVMDLFARAPVGTPVAVY